MGKFVIRKAAPGDLPLVSSLISSGREIMRASGNPHQWPEGTPSEATLMADIDAGNAYLMLQDGCAVATFAFIEGPDPTYAAIYGGSWLSDDPYFVIHRLAKRAEAGGVFRELVRWAFCRATSIRIDTHRDNVVMQKCLRDCGFSYCGIIYLQNGEERLAFQKNAK